jgi:gas vesicle protein
MPGPGPGDYGIPGGCNVELEPRQRSALIIGAVVGAVLGAGAGWLLAQSANNDSDESRQPIRPGDVLKLVRNGASLLRQLDDLRHRM